MAFEISDIRRCETSSGEKERKEADTVNSRVVRKCKYCATKQSYIWKKVSLPETSDVSCAYICEQCMYDRKIRWDS